MASLTNGGYCLKLMTFNELHHGTGEVKDLPIVFVGNMTECAKRASRADYQWKPNKNVFGGYWYNKNLSQCLFHDTI